MNRTGNKPTPIFSTPGPEGDLPYKKDGDSYRAFMGLKISFGTSSGTQPQKIYRERFAIPYRVFSRKKFMTGNNTSLKILVRVMI